MKSGLPSLSRMSTRQVYDPAVLDEKPTSHVSICCGAIVIENGAGGVIEKPAQPDVGGLL